MRRELWHLRSQPGQIISALLFPVALVVLFGYVFGSAIAVPGGGNYRQYLMPGLFVMTSAFAVVPAWLRAIADWNPVSAVTAASRQLSGNPGAPPADSAWPLQHPVTATLAWSALLLLAFAPLAVHRYASAT